MALANLSGGLDQEGASGGGRLNLERVSLARLSPNLAAFQGNEVNRLSVLLS